MTGWIKKSGAMQHRAPVLFAVPVLLSLIILVLFWQSRADAAFNASYIVPDSYFTNTGTMGEADIQAFLAQKGYLANYSQEPTSARIGPSDNVDPSGWSASHIISQVSQWYGINPQVILATLQKEQSLVQRTDYGSPAYVRALNYAMGYGCPDSTGCTGNSYPGFARQVDMGTWQLHMNQVWANTRSGSAPHYFTGDTVSIDGTPVYLGNGATGALYRYTPHFHGNQLFYDISHRWGWIDYVPAQIGNVLPTGETSNNRPLIYADISGSDISSVNLKLDGVDVSGSATVTSTYVSYRRPQSQPLAAGPHTVELSVSDSMGANPTRSWQFTVSANNSSPQDYYWTWYDGISSRNWVLMANPGSSATSFWFDVYIGGRYMSGSLQVPPGQTATPRYGGVMGGPVVVPSITGDKAIVSQRILWGQNSFEEVPGIEKENLSDHYYWTWYDQLSPGFQNWVLVANPGENRSGSPQGTVTAHIKIGNRTYGPYSIPPGSNVTPTFPGVMGGPVEVYTDGGDVIASQRVLSNFGDAFNEEPGIPAQKLGDHYLWTWYDMTGGARNWVLVANPGQAPVTVEIKIAGVRRWGPGMVNPGQNVTPTFPGTMGGPVEVIADGNVIASQRSIWGPSFEEVSGVSTQDLNLSNVWTWYDQASTGARNWVLIANPGFNRNNAAQGAVTAYVKIGSSTYGPYSIPPGANVTPAFPGVMGGPVQVYTDGGDVMASQRVLWNGYFNELTGGVL